MTQSTASQPLPQGDGRPGESTNRPFYVGGVNFQSRRGPAFQPSAIRSIEARDLAITLLVDRLVPILFEAMQAHALGAIDGITLDELPEETITALRRQARLALNSQSTLHRDEARRMARLALAKEVRNAALHFPYLNPLADETEQRRRNSAMNVVMRHLELLKVDEQITEAFEAALAEPMTGSAGSQVARTAIGGWR